jgi:hypothetical protein
MLPSTVPTARIMRFAYESQWLGKEAVHQRLPLVADRLLCGLGELRHGCPDRPVIFIGHCFGGIVIQKAVIAAKLHAKDYPSISRAVSGIVFLGTPNRGSGSQSKAAVIAAIAAMTGFGERSSLLSMLERDSEPLRDLFSDFVRLAVNDAISLTCFFELHKSRVADIVIPRSMRWLSQLSELVVDEESGCIDGYPRYGLATDHFNLQRFSGSDDGNYQAVKAEVVRLVAVAESRVSFGEAMQVKQAPDIQTQAKDEECLSALFLTDPEEDMRVIEGSLECLRAFESMLTCV